MSACSRTGSRRHSLVSCLSFSGAGRGTPAGIAFLLAMTPGLMASGSAIAQDAKSSSGAKNDLPPVVVEQPKTAAKAKPKAAKAKKSPGAVQPAQAAKPAGSSAQASGDTSSGGPVAPDTRSGSLTVPTTAEARADIQRTPGGVEVVPDTAFKNTPANTVKDVLGSVPGVTVQTRWGPDARLSIRGSGLTRSYGNRGLNMYMDGIAINTSDGLFDLFEIDPSAYRYVEVYKGANALRFGSNSLGGAINFVTPTGRDASPFEFRVDVGSFGYVRTQMSSGGVSGLWDYFINVSAQREDGFRDHSEGDIERLNANLGYRISPDAETRFYVNANSWRAELPGEVTKEVALNSPRTPASEFVRQEQQRNIDSIRVANKTTLRFDGTLVEFGVYTHQRQVDHPIFEYLDYYVHDYGGFVRTSSDWKIGGFRNRLVTGVNILDGELDYRQYVNQTGAVKGALTFSSLDKSENVSVYAENSFYVLPTVSLVAGTQFQHTVRDREDRFLSDGDQSGRRTFDIWSPKIGMLWDVDPAWQVFANVSRSAEVPTFDVNTFATPASTNVNAQTATTYEIGTRGSGPDFIWDVSLYRAEISNELQCLTPTVFAACTTVNADRTVHQGIEAGWGWAFAKSVVDTNDRVWLNLTYTYNDFFFDGDAKWGNNRLPGVAPHSIRAEVLYRDTNGFYAGPNVEWMPEEYYVDNANSVTVDPFALLNFKIGIDRPVGWSAYLEGRNLLDRRYISSTITMADASTPVGFGFPGSPTFTPLFGEFFNPGTGAAVYSGVRYKW
jgi:iron complex outermembrane receptor protein